MSTQAQIASVYRQEVRHPVDLIRNGRSRRLKEISPALRAALRSVRRMNADIRSGRNVVLQ